MPKRRRLFVRSVVLAVFGAGCMDENGGFNASGRMASPELYQVLEASVQYLLDDYDKEDARLLKRHGRTGVRADFPGSEPRYAVSFVPFSGGVPRPDPFPGREGFAIYDDEGKQVRYVHPIPPSDFLDAGAVSAWDELGAAMRTTEAWQYDPLGDMIAISEPPPDDNAMILTLGNLQDEGLYAGEAGDGVYYVAIRTRPPWHWLAPWKFTPDEGSWTRSELWVDNHLRVERTEDGWRITRPQDSDVVFREH